MEKFPKNKHAYLKICGMAISIKSNNTNNNSFKCGLY